MNAFVAREIEMLEVGSLVRANKNARTHSAKQIRKLADAIKRFGFSSPIVIDENGIIVAGHGRLEALKLLGWKEAPCIRWIAKDATEKRAYAIAENQISMLAGWDKDILAVEMQELQEAGFPMELTGFELADIDQIITDFEEASDQPTPPEDAQPTPPAAADAVSRKLDLWYLGRHRLLCGDAKDPESYSILMAGEEAAMVFTDPPYNVPIEGNVSGLGKTKHKDFAEASGEMSTEVFTGFLKTTLALGANACRDGAILYVCMDWRHIEDLIAAGKDCGLEYKNLCVWVKTNGGMGAFYRSKHELVTVWKVGQAPHTNTFGLGEKGRSRTNVWTYAGVNTFKADRMEELHLHPTVKPTALVADAIRDVSHRGEIVLDMFGGSGTTLIAAHKTGRKARVIELDPAYCDATISRWQRLTGKQAVLAETKETFEAVAERRRKEKSGWTRIPAASDQRGEAK